MDKLGVRDDILYEFLAYYFLNTLGLSLDNLFPKRKGIFKRYVAKDVENISHKTFASFQKLEFSLNREGLYDALPESLFHYHSSFKDVRGQSTDGFKNQLKLLNEEERYARSYFSVFESEISKLKVAARYLEESSVSYDFGIVFEHLLELIPIDLRIFDNSEKLKILKLLPEINSIFIEEGYSGISRILNYVFDLSTKVNGKQIYKWTEADEALNLLGNQYLGLDSTLGNISLQYEWVLDVVIHISELQKSEYESEDIDNKVKQFLLLVAPFYYSIRIDKQLKKDDFVLDTLDYHHRLGQMVLS